MKKILLLSVFLLSACTASPRVPEIPDTISEASLADLPQAKPSEIVELKDGDQYVLTASFVQKVVHGNRLKMLAYNEMIPGPFFQVQQGTEATIRVVNHTNIPTLFHSHGLRLDNASDGTHLTQDPIPVGGSFEYTLTFPDAGIYWYHPHLREDYAQEMGLYGNYLVSSEDPEYWSPVNRALPLVLDDMLLENGKMSPFYEDFSTHALLGRVGNTFLINGADAYDLQVSAGEVLRFYVTNVANARFFTLKIPGAQMKLVGADASKYSTEQFVDRVLLAPSERAVIEVLFEQPGTYELVNDVSDGRSVLGSITVDSEPVSTSYGDAFQTLRENSDVQQDIAQYTAFFDREPDKRLSMVLAMGGHGGGMGGSMGMGGGMPSGMQLMMNDHATTDMIRWELIDQDTGMVNEDIDWSFRQGDVVKLRIYNDPRSVQSMQHPIHLHGQRFLVLETNGRRNSNLAWKDTFTVLSGDTVDILVEMSNPGSWMLHCHIAEHLEADMMLAFEVLP